MLCPLSYANMNIYFENYKISGDMTMNFKQHDAGFGRNDFERNDFPATWPKTFLRCLFL